MANLSIFIMKENITIFLTALSSRKRRGRMISAEDKAWLTNHIVKAMLNYPGAVLLGEKRVKTILHNAKVQH